MEPVIHPVFRLVFLLFIVAIIVLEFPGARSFIESPYSGIETKNLVVQRVRDDGPNADKDLRFRDEIVRVDGERVRNVNHLRYLTHANNNISQQQYTLSRDGEIIEIQIDYSPVPDNRVREKFAFLIVAFTFLLVGGFVYIRRSDLLGGLFSLNCSLIAYLLTDRPAVASPYLQLFGELFHDLVIVLFPVVFLSFFLLFPDRQRSPGHRRRWLRRLFIIGIPLMIYLVVCYMVVTHFFLLPVNFKGANAIMALTTLYLSAYLIASLVIFIRNYFAAPSAQKQRLRIAITGTIMGIIPFLAVLVWRQFNPGTSNHAEVVSVCCLTFISISFAYAILKHGAIELNVFVRKSIVYAFLTGGIIAAYYMLVYMVGDFFTREFSLSRTGFTIFSILILSIIFAPTRNWVQQIVDRVFYRGDYVYKEEVVQFNRLLSRKLNRDEIFQCFFDRVEKLLGSSYIAIYTKMEEKVFSLEKSSGASPSLPPTISPDSQLINYLSQQRVPLMAEYLYSSWEEKYLDGDSRTFLSATKTAVCLPVVSPETLLSFVLLGAKRSGLPYSRADAELLQTFSELLGVVLENASLHDATVKQERLVNEVLVAQDIQLSLLPKAPPKHESIEIVGKMMSSREVGGDYFDYFQLDPAHIALAIGDVSGKGIPAAMLMFSIQALFKSLALRDKLSPKEVTEELNRHLCETAKSGQFTTFFYGVLDLDQSTFRYSNAGHCPALLVKENYADRLGEGGLMLGVEKDAQYAEGSVQLAPDDLLCLYTDGVTEQKDGADDDFGEARLIDFVRMNRYLPTDSLQEALFDAVISFGDRRQDDDITTVIARYKGS
jgi:sigma-B regulation protein RsbU (phosphoserine phosphatase)